MAQERADRCEADRLSPDRPCEDKTPVGITAPPEYVQPSDSSTASRDHGQNGQAHGSESVCAVLGRFLGLGVSRIGSAERVAHVFVRVPSERTGCVRPRPRSEQGFAQAFHIRDCRLPPVHGPRGWSRRLWNRAQPLQKMLVPLTEQQAQRSWLDFCCLVSLPDGSVADQGGPQVSGVPVGMGGSA